MSSTLPFTPELRALVRDVVRAVLATDLVTAFQQADGPPALPFEIKLGKTAAAIAKNASGTVNIWRGAKGSEAHTADDDVTAYNRSFDLGSGVWVLVVYFAGGWEIVPLECP
jgi:hypothetical protein